MMGGLFGVISKDDVVMDLFFGTDYHSHLGTKKGGVCVWGEEGFIRSIHSIENSPFRTKFDAEIGLMRGNKGIGCISDTESQPLTVLSRQGDFAIGTVGVINNKKELVENFIKKSSINFMTMNGGDVNNTELVSKLISQKENLVEGIHYAMGKIAGSMTVLVLTENAIYAARDIFGRTPLVIGEKKDGYCIASESFSFLNLGYKLKREIGAGEIVKITEDGIETMIPARDKMKICTFLWTYYGYPTSVYEGENVESVRYRNGELLAKADEENNLNVDFVSGVPDSGVAHAIGYSTYSKIPYARPLIKYTPTWPRSFMPQNQKARNLIAKMKLIPVKDIIKGKKFVLIDDSIVRGTQFGETLKVFHDNGVKEVHVRSACPPVMYGCKYLNFSRSISDMELITRRVISELENGEITDEILREYADNSTERYKNMVEKIREKLNVNSVGYQTLDNLLAAVNVDRCKLCTYCWNGKE